MGTRIFLATARETERQLLVYLLKHEGYAVTAVDSVADDLARLRAADVDLILIEAALAQAGQAGIAVTSRRPGAPLAAPVAVYGRARSAEEVASAVKAGVAEWICRESFTVESFIQHIQRLCRPTEPLPAESGRPLIASVVAADAAANDEEATDRLTETDLADLASGPGAATAFEFNLVEVMTHCGRQAEALDQRAALLMRDPMMSIRVLNAANGAADQRGAARTASVRDAVQALDAHDFHQLAESINPLQVATTCSWDAGHFWAHSVATSRLGGMLAERMGLGTAVSAVMTAGLVHDVGFQVLASQFPRQFERLFCAAAACESPTPTWEAELIGQHHGAIAAALFEQLQLPELLADVARNHHTPAADRQTLKTSSRVVALIVEAADRMANALFPGDPPLAILSGISDEFEAAIRHGNLAAADLIRDARRIMAELVTEMGYFFPGALKSPYFHTRKPFETITYFAPQARALDVIRLFVETRCHQVEAISRIRDNLVNDGTPIVVNLEHIPNVDGQVESLTSLMAAGLTNDRQGVVLLPGRVHNIHRTMVGNNWSLLAVPTHPVAWVRRLAQPLQTEPASLESLVA